MQMDLCPRTTHLLPSSDVYLTISFETVCHKWAPLFAGRPAIPCTHDVSAHLIHTRVCIYEAISSYLGSVNMQSVHAEAKCLRLHIKHEDATTYIRFNVTPPKYFFKPSPPANEIGITARTGTERPRRLHIRTRFRCSWTFLIWDLAMRDAPASKPTTHVM